MPAQAQLPDGSIQSLNQSKKVGYMGMGAAAVGPNHHYTFELYALDTKLSRAGCHPGRCDECDGGAHPDEGCACRPFPSSVNRGPTPK